MIENDYTIYDGDVHNSFIRLIKLSKENGRIKELIKMIEDIDGIQVIEEILSIQDVNSFIIPNIIYLAAELGIS